ncbi:MAG: HAD family phosphatase [Nitrospirae bacterium]|nr:HAD family phosphatase [Nitrospirota bacterium]
MIKLIIFDLGKVILDFSISSVAEGLARSSNHMSYKDPGKIADYLRLHLTDIAGKYERGEIRSDEFYSHIKESFYLDLSYDQFKQIWNDIFRENEGVADLIRLLKKDFRLCLLSNTNELHFEYIKKSFPIVYKFDMWVLSYEVGVMKPDPEIFRIALKKTGVEAGEAIFIDDIKGHVLGAQGLGINSVEFKSVAQITRFIEETVNEQSAK